MSEGESTEETFETHKEDRKGLLVGGEAAAVSGSAAVLQIVSGSL